MPDREKVIKAFRTRIISDSEEWNIVEIPVGEAVRILELLIEQETADTGRCRVFQCEKCGYGIEDIFVNDEFKYPIDPRYCPNCGRNVKRDDI